MRRFTTNRVYNVLFLCTGNSARSILAESILNKRGKRQFRAFSAGSHPNGVDEFTAPSSPHFDFIDTVCDNAAGEICPVWLGNPTTAHWGIPDPAAVQGPDIEKKAAFAQAFELMSTRINLFLSLPLSSIDELRIKEEKDAIGKPPLAGLSS